MTITEAYTLYAAPIRAYIAKKVLSQELADDLVQETFIKAWRAWQSRRGGSLQSWLYRIAHNVMVDHLQRGALVVAPLEDAGMAVNQVDEIEALAERECIEATFAALSPNQANALRLWLDGGNLPQKHLVERSGVSEHNFRAYVSRGRKQFAVKYAEQRKGA